MHIRSPIVGHSCAAIAALALFPALAAPDGARAEDDGEAFELGDIFVVGSRRPVRSVSDAPAPIDLIGGEDFTDQGATSVPELMRTLVPSYNVNTQPISDAATFIRPANLRGLAPDQTLVFVNGKRRHRAAVISWLGNGVSEGAQGPDIGVIPAIALKRVEVLRDTASAQYGSDAIAGVINFVLKDRPSGGTVETQWGRTYEGDGDEYRLAANAGLPIGETGFANISAQWHEAEPTVRSVQRDDAAALSRKNPHIRTPYAQIWGAPDVSGDYTVFLNTGMDVGETAKIYAFGNIANRESEGGFFFRNPNSRSSVFTEDRDHDDNSDTDKLRYRLVADLDTEDSIICPTGIRVDPTEYFDADAIERNIPSGCFVFNGRFPGGFTPLFKGEVSDSAGTAGVRGALDSGLTYDVSYTVGRNEIEFSMRDTVNASLGPATPTKFDLGSYTQTEQTVNLDLTHEVDVTAFASPLHAAAGVEWRQEQFEIDAGERASWKVGPFAEQGLLIGANGFSGFSPTVAGKWDRSNVAAYVEFEADVADDLTLATMGRVEHFEEFDTTTDFKVGGLYRVNANVGLRGSASTGFRAPTVGQQNVLNVTTAFITGADGRSQLTQRGTIPATCPEAAAVGARPLDPEESVTFTAGVTMDAGPFALTADVYNIEVEDRLGLSQDRNLSDAQKAKIVNGCLPAEDVSNFRYFGNGFDTRTQGIDVIASVDLPPAMALLETGETEIVFVGNYTKTEVTQHDPLFIDEQRINQLEDALPRFRFNATLRHKQPRWSAFTRLNYFGPYEEYHGDVEAWLLRPGAEITVDVEASYRPVEGVELSIGAENLLNNFPDKNPFAGQLGSQYPESSPMGFAGGFYYARARYSW